MRIAMIGSRGLPARWGGVERHVEELGARLVERGHEVTVFARPGYSDEVGGSHRGIDIRVVPTRGGKGVEAMVHSLNSARRSLGDRYDVVHFHAVGPGLAAPLPRGLSRAAIVQTIHGLDADRAKWNAGQSAVLRLGTWLSARVPHRTIVVSRDLERHYRETYGTSAVYVPNGVAVMEDDEGVDVRERFGLGEAGYVLWVGRLVPEKAIHVLLEAFAHVPGDVELVIAGGSSHTDDYVTRLEELATLDPRVRLVGYVFGGELTALYRDAKVFVLPSALEGLPITLLEAALHGVPLIVSSIPPNLEVVGGERPGVRLVEPGSVIELAEAITASLQQGEAEREGARAVRDDVLAHYDWDAVAERTEQVYEQAVQERRRRGRRNQD